MRRSGYIESGSWQDRARAYIAGIDAALPADLDFKLRKKLISKAYPWGERKHWPYKMWLKAQARYLARFPEYRPRLQTPIERYINDSIRGENQARTLQ